MVEPDSGPVPYPTKAHITAARDERKRYLPLWRKNLDRYRAGMPGVRTTDEKSRIRVNKDYAKTEQKKGQLFYQRPDVQLEPLQPNLESLTPLVQSRLNQQLGPKAVDAKRLVDQLLADVLIASGIGISEIGMEVFTETQQLPDPNFQPDPIQTQIAAMMGSPPPEAPLVPQEVPVYTRFFWDRISPARLLLPADWHGSRFEDAPWMGYDFLLDRSLATRLYKVPPDTPAVTDKDNDDDALVITKGDRGGGQVEKIRGTKIWFKAIHFDPTAHPLLFRECLYIDGIDTPFVRDSPYQVLDPQSGQMRGMIGNPIHPLTLRDTPDSPYVASDCQVSRQQVDELSKFRTTLTLQRDRAIPMRVGSISALGQGNVNKIEAGEWQEVLLCDTLEPNNPPLQEITRAEYPRENFTAQDYIDNDINELWALSANQQGQQTDTRRTATELNLMQGATDVRLDAERNRVLEWYAGGAEKLCALLIQFDDQQDWITVVGDDGSQRLQQWPSIQPMLGRWAFSILPDSSRRIDASQEREQLLRAYQFLANDPTVNRTVLVEKVARMFNFDPTKILQPPPPPHPNPPSMSLAIKGEDFVGPQAPVIFEIVQQLGLQISPQAMQQTQALAAIATALSQQKELAEAQGTPPAQQGVPPHGGAQPMAEELGKHQASINAVGGAVN